MPKDKAPGLSVSRQGILVLAGFGVAVRVEHGHLCVRDGETEEEISIPRIAKLKRLIVIGHSGYISFDAVKWLHDTGASFAMLDYDSTILLHSIHAGVDLPVLRRKQAALTLDTGALAIAHYLCQQKVNQQLALLAGIDATVSQQMQQQLQPLDTLTSRDAIMKYEMDIALRYWGLLARWPLRFWRDMPVPEHWRTIGSRISPLSASPRRAVTPFHAMLNYLYAIVELESAIALQAIGLDPGLGFLHADLQNRLSLACDVMEPVRPLVDDWLLSLIEKHIFRRSDFTETSAGECRLTAPIRATLTATAPIWRAEIAPIVERVASMVIAHIPKRPSKAEPIPAPAPIAAPAPTPAPAPKVEPILAAPTPPQAPTSPQAPTPVPAGRRVPQSKRPVTRRDRREAATQEARDLFASVYDAIADEIVETMEWKKER
jgi:CRISPR-associated endonuclease Cas1